MKPHVVEETAFVVLLNLVDTDRVLCDQKEFVSLLAAGDKDHHLSPIITFIQVRTIFEQ